MPYEQFRVSYWKGQGVRHFGPELELRWIWRGREYVCTACFGVCRVGFDRRTDPHGCDIWSLGLFSIAAGGGWPVPEWNYSSHAGIWP